MTEQKSYEQCGKDGDRLLSVFYKNKKTQCKNDIRGAEFRNGRKKNHQKINYAAIYAAEKNGDGTVRTL